MQIRKLKHSIYLLPFALLFIGISCSKDDELDEKLKPNLNAEISQETISIHVKEGDFATFNYNLTEVLSEDLPIKVLISTKNIVLPIDEDDYNFEFQFKGDLDDEWRRSKSHEIFFPKGNISMKIRIQIVDDKNFEANEEFNFSIDLGESNEDFKIMSLDQLQAIKVTVINDDRLDLIKPGQAAELVAYKVDDNYNFTLKRANNNLLTRGEKVMLDKLIKEGFPEEIKKDLKTAFESAKGDVKLTSFVIIADSSLSYGGYVFNNGYDLTTWEMGLNFFFAYPELTELSINANNTNEDIQSAFSNYNKNGTFGYIMIHEFGHTLTLNSQQLIPQTYDENGPIDLNCPVASFVEGCPRSGSIATAFLTQLDTGIEPYNVSEYAASNLGEDLAETFAWAVIQEEIPESDETNSIALQKINFIKNYPHFVERDYRSLRNKIRSDFTKIDDTKVPIFNYNAKTGKHISCIRKRANVQQ